MLSRSTSTSKSSALFSLQRHCASERSYPESSMTSARTHGGNGAGGSAVLTARAKDRLVRDLHRRVLERVLLKSKTQSVKDAFRLYDRDRAGVLTADQFRALMRDHDFLEADTELLIRHLDGRGQNSISFHAFLGDIQLGTEQNYPKNGGASPKKVQQLTQLGHGQQKNKANTKPKADASKTVVPKPSADVNDPMEAIRTKLRQRVMGSKSIREVFMEYDVDSSGYLDYHEFGRFMAKYKFTPKETQFIVEYLDTDSSGTIDYDEFAAGLLFYRPPIAPAVPVHRTPIAEKNFANPASQNTQIQSTRSSKALQKIDVQQIRQAMHRKLDETLKKAVRPRDMRAEFDNYDVDGSSSLDHQEFGALLIGIGIKLKPHELRALLQEIDPDGSERISFHTFAELLGIRDVDSKANGGSGETRRHAPPQGEYDELFTSFHKFDREGSRELDYEEFRRLMNESGVTDNEEINALIDEIDEDGRGSISFNEFERVYDQRIKHSLRKKQQRQAPTFNSYSGVSSDDEVQPARTPRKLTPAGSDYSAKSRLAALQEQELQLMERVLRRHNSIEAAFSEFGQDNRNEMDFEQFRDFMGQYGITDEASITMLLKRLDADNSGMIDLQEFLSVFDEQRLARLKSISKPVDQGDQKVSPNTRLDGGSNATSKAKLPTSLNANRRNKAAQLRALEERWITNALAGHSSVRSAFATVDHDQDGEITCDEFRKLMNLFGIYEEQDISSLLKKLDLDGNGCIEYDEFTTVFHEARVAKDQERRQNMPANVPSVVKAAPAEPKNARSARLRELQLKWMRRVLSCHDSIETAFYQYDDDGNGELDHDEFRHFMKRYGIAKNEDIDLLTRRLDTDGSGTISFDEFSVIFNSLRLSPGNTSDDLSTMAAAAPDEIFGEEELESILEIERDLAQRMAHQTRDLRLAFRKFDTNGNGLLEYKEFRAVLKSYRLPEMEIRKVIRHLDRDVSGFIDYKEFIAGFGAFKESGGTGVTNQKKSVKRASPGKAKPRAHYRRSPSKPQGHSKSPPLETLKKTMLDRILAAHGTVQAAFREYDLNKEGCLNEAQFVKLVLDCGFSRDEAARLLDIFDQDQSGTVEYEEFLAQLVVKGSDRS